MTETEIKQKLCLYIPETERRENEDAGSVAIYLKEASTNHINLPLCFMVEISIRVFDNEEPGSHVPFQQSPFQTASPKIALP